MHRCSQLIESGDVYFEPRQAAELSSSAISGRELLSRHLTTIRNFMNNYKAHIQTDL